MDFTFTPQQDAFRQEVRGFLKEALPPDWAGSDNAIDEESFGYGREFLHKLAPKHWIAPAWPREYGGLGLGLWEQVVFSEEMAYHRAPLINAAAVGYLGPTIMLFGSDEQKRQHLPGITSGEVIWCQGYSESGAGSDLASLQTRAVQDGDDFIINGQKIWTSQAHYADWMFLLARTDPDAPKHKGISYFILDMKSPGIEVRPLVNMANNHDFNEVFFDNVRVPKENLLGEENRGWYVGTTTLDFERSGIATSVSHGLMVSDLAAWVREHRDAPYVNRSEQLRYEVADRAIESEVEQMLSYQVISMQNRGLVPNKESSIAKLYSSELDIRIAGTALEALGLYGQLKRGSAHAQFNGRAESAYLYATTSTVGGGTSEIQRNIIASRGLGLPRD